MKPKEVTDRLGITRDRIKYYKKQGVFQPDIPSRGRANYTESDVKKLRKLEVLTKAGVSCAPIKKIQGGSLTLTQAMKECQKSMYEEKKRIEGSLMLLELMMNDEADYDSLDTDYYWNFIEDKKREGIVFLENPEMDFMPVSMERSITCPCCGDTQEVDLEDFLADEAHGDSRCEDDMGPDIVYSFDSEETYECPTCGKVIRVKGWIREYPIGAYDSQSITVEAIGGITNGNQ